MGTYKVSIKGESWLAKVVSIPVGLESPRWLSQLFLAQSASGLDYEDQRRRFHWNTFLCKSKFFVKFPWILPFLIFQFFVTVIFFFFCCIGVWQSLAWLVCWVNWGCEAKQLEKQRVGETQSKRDGPFLCLTSAKFSEAKFPRVSQSYSKPMPAVPLVGSLFSLGIGIFQASL